MDLIQIRFRTASLSQETENSSVYTKLSCFLPWIANQYDMDITENIEDENLECSKGSGDINDFNSDECRCTCAGESLCIFPFYWNGKLYDQCTFLEEEEFLFPVFRCPIRNITRKIDGINSFYYKDLITQQDDLGFCVAKGEDFKNSSAVLDPDLDCDYYDRSSFLAPCKNNCRGGKFHTSRQEMEPLLGKPFSEFLGCVWRSSLNCYLFGRWIWRINTNCRSADFWYVKRISIFNPMSIS